MDLGLAGKSVIVTGAASNIGRAIALAFAAEGARLAIADLDEAQAQKVGEAARAAGAADVLVQRTDVTDLAQVEGFFATVAQRFGGLHVLVNGVGWDKLMWFRQTTPDFWDRIIRINYLGVIHCTKAALDHMVPGGGGAIVSISSDASRQGEPREAVYGGCKAAINSFMKTIAKEHGRDGIRCNVVCPGVTIPDETEEVSANSMWAQRDAMFTPEQREKVAKTLPLKKIGRPQDVAPAVLFLASNQVAGHITGQVVSASGGYSMIG